MNVRVGTLSAALIFGLGLGLAIWSRPSIAAKKTIWVKAHQAAPSDATGNPVGNLTAASEKIEGEFEVVRDSTNSGKNQTPDNAALVIRDTKNPSRTFVTTWQAVEDKPGTAAAGAATAILSKDKLMVCGLNPKPDTTVPEPGSVRPKPAPADPVLTPDTVPNAAYQTIAISHHAADDARQRAIVDVAAAIVEANARDAESDQSALSELYTDLPLQSLGERLERAQNTLSQAVSDLESATSGLDRGEITRFRNTYLNARDKAALGLDAIQEEKNKQNTLGANSPFMGLLGGDQNPLAKTQTLADVFGSKVVTNVATSQDALTNRLVMLNGLPAAQRAKAARALRLRDTPTLTLATGQKKAVEILHNGYIFGGSRTGKDCSMLASRALPADIRKGDFTTLDLRAMWVYGRSGRFPNPPIYQKEREALVRKTSQAFTPVDIYQGDKLQTGDLLVYRLPWGNSGHVFIVRSYNPATLTAEVMEASQSAGTLRERAFQLSLDPADQEERILRPGLMGLRLKPADNAGCGYRETPAPQAPAAPPAKGGAAS